jgi:cobalt-zinc-cadmium efflux system protein
MSTTETALTVHLLVPSGYPGDAYTAQVAAGLKERFGMDHATIQIETDPADSTGRCNASKMEA